MCSVELEVDQATGFACLLETDPATRSTYFRAYVSCVLCIPLLSRYPKVNKLLDASTLPSIVEAKVEKVLQVPSAPNCEIDRLLPFNKEG